METVVDAPCGKLEGAEERALLSFRGIPFARPPRGARRFRAPEPPARWRGVRDATHFGSSAPQAKLDFDLIPGLDVGVQSEDCLYLNVYTTAADAELRPVMVWIHGGSFTVGSGSQSLNDLRPLARRGGVVVVSLNYRLGALGFLALKDLVGADFGAATNSGLLDQIAALTWVRDNIEAFGGDPSNVTIFGESAGGMSVGTLLGTPAARGLFRRAIAMSGAAHRVNRPEAAAEVATTLLRELDIEPGAAARLRDVPVERILEAQGRCIDEIERENARRAFCPVIDGSEIPAAPIEAIRGGLAEGVDLMVGSTRDEWKLFGFMDPQASKLDEASLVARVERRVPGSGQRLVDAYRASRGERGAGVTPADLFFALETDRMFGVPAIRLAEAVAGSARPAWAYRVDWESPMMDGALGACHGIDVPFVLGAIGTPGASLFAGEGKDAVKLQEQMMGAWVAFARDGDPCHDGLPDWPAYDADRRATMIFDRNSRVADDPDGDERHAWEGVL